MLCDDYSMLLSAYLDNEATPAERRQVEAHLPCCAVCQAELNLLRETARVTALLPDRLPPPELRERIFALTTHRPSVWERFRALALRPELFTPALAAGLVALVALTSRMAPRPGVAPHPPAPQVAQSRKASELAKKAAVASAKKKGAMKVAPAPPVKQAPTVVTPAAPSADETPNDFEQFLADLKRKLPHPDFLAPRTPKLAQGNDLSRRRFGERVGAPVAAAPAHSRVASAIARPKSLAPAMRVSPPGLTPKRGTVASGLSKGKLSRPVRLSHGSRSDSPDVPYESIPAPASKDSSTVALAPTPAPPAAPPVSRPDTEVARTPRSDNPVADALVNLSEPRSADDARRRVMDEVVNQINASAVTTASTARQIKWNFARKRF